MRLLHLYTATAEFSALIIPWHSTQGVYNKKKGGGGGDCCWSGPGQFPGCCTRPALGGSAAPTGWWAKPVREQLIAYGV